VEILLTYFFFSISNNPHFEISAEKTQKEVCTNYTVKCTVYNSDFGFFSQFSKCFLTVIVPFPFKENSEEVVFHVNNYDESHKLRRKYAILRYRYLLKMPSQWPFLSSVQCTQLP
jgi:hypothetical protein